MWQTALCLYYIHCSYCWLDNEFLDNVKKVIHSFSDSSFIFTVLVFANDCSVLVSVFRNLFFHSCQQGLPWWVSWSTPLIRGWQLLLAWASPHGILQTVCTISHGVCPFLLLLFSQFGSKAVNWKTPHRLAASTVLWEDETRGLFWHKQSALCVWPRRGRPCEHRDQGTCSCVDLSTQELQGQEALRLLLTGLLSR